MKQFLKISITLLLYIITMSGIGYEFGMPAVEKLKWPVVLCFIIGILLSKEKPKKFKRVDPDKFKDIKIILADQDESQKRDKEIRALLTIIMDKDIAETALITDESCIFDFFFDVDLETEAVNKIHANLGKDVGIVPEDYLWVAVDKIRKEFSNWPNSKLTLVK